VDRFDIFKDIAERTQGDIYIGVVGPVRSGKSTLIKRFMELVVLPNIRDAGERQRTIDALPQSGGGRRITTTEPKFIPDDGVEVELQENVNARVRLVDCVGYTVPGALGYEEDDQPRMVRTPWFEHEVPFQEAAELGTRKVIQEHSTVGLVVTSDGTCTDIPRENYAEAEERVIAELTELEKPFIVVLNTAAPEAPETAALVDELQERYGVPVLAVDCLRLSAGSVDRMFETLLYEFPVREVMFDLPRWFDELEDGHWLKEKSSGAVAEAVENVRRLRDIDDAVERLARADFAEEVGLANMDLGTGVATIEVIPREDLYYEVLSELAESPVAAPEDLVRLVRALAGAKREYDKVAVGLAEVRENGYGVVTPSLEDMEFEEPNIVRRGGQFGVRLLARAPSLHLIRADIEMELVPSIGSEKQSEDLLRYLMEQFEDDPRKLWESGLFGRSLHELLREGIQNKLYRMPENAQKKLQETIQRIVNEGSAGLICIII